jgi:hypothetical protein
MARKPNPRQTTPPLPVRAPAAPAPAPRPTAGSGDLGERLDFRPVGQGEMWRVEKFAEIAAELGLAEQHGQVLPPEVVRARWEEFARWCPQHPKMWLIVRRLYGVAPVIPAPDANPNDLRLWTRAELENDGYAVAAELELMRALWFQHEQRERGEAPAAPASESPAAELALDDRVLDEFQFVERMFRISVWDPLANGGEGAALPRAEAENKSEREWFVRRVIEWRRMLKDPLGGSVARSALLNDLYLRRMEAEIATASPKQRPALYEQKAALAKEYGSAIERLQEMFPELAVAGRQTAVGTYSALIMAHQDYYGQGDRRRVDGIHTATELEFLLRSSHQVEARYRFGLNLAIIDAINGIWDPEFRPRIKPSTQKRLTEIARAVIKDVRDHGGESVVDLEDGVMPGEGDEFEDFLDARCPHCGAGISSSARRCPECRRQVTPATAINHEDKTEDKPAAQE